ncbi:hypothetical protein [Microbacterium sp. USTB-Y]|uniref:hypothetical protein n=1 Tax=Microbacterium sp. USTB-Y TaxID=2823692 RepID=UPI00203FD17F|nr:hypothetical protein [Microbacterium sp. USTB-Y]
MNPLYRNVGYTTFSGWIDSPADLAPPLQETLECDVAVVGGVGGMSTCSPTATRSS